MSSLPAKIKILLILAKKSQKIVIKRFCGALFHMVTRVSLKYFVIGPKQGYLQTKAEKMNINTELFIIELI